MDAACHAQIVVGTQSTAIVDCFSANDVTVIERDSTTECTLARKLSENDYRDWLEEDVFRALWNKNIIGGRHVRNLDKYWDPEMIDDGPTTAPSKRIVKALEKHYHYTKVKSGASVTSRIGIEALLENCTHFSEWIELIKNNSTCSDPTFQNRLF